MTPVRLGPYGALWWCLRCGHEQHHEGPWHIVEHDARREAAGHECQEQEPMSPKAEDAIKVWGYRQVAAQHPKATFITRVTVDMVDTGTCDTCGGFPAIQVTASVDGYWVEINRWSFEEVLAEVIEIHKALDATNQPKQ